MTNSKKTVWIPVKKSDGMFASEWAIELTTADGLNVSFFIDKSLVEERQNSATLKVTLVETDQEARRTRVLLPTETFETSSRWVDVPGVLSAA